MPPKWKLPNHKIRLFQYPKFVLYITRYGILLAGMPLLGERRKDVLVDTFRIMAALFDWVEPVGIEV